MNRSERLRQLAELSEDTSLAWCAIEAADRLDELEAQVGQQGCNECATLGHHQNCDGYIPSIGELLGDY